MKDKSLFSQVSIDAEAGTLVWANGSDYDSSMLYAWDVDIEAAYVDQMKQIENCQANISLHSNAGIR